MQEIEEDLTKTNADKAEFRIKDVNFGDYNNKAIAVLNSTTNSLFLVEITEE